MNLAVTIMAGIAALTATSVIGGLAAAKRLKTATIPSVCGVFLILFGITLSGLGLWLGAAAAVNPTALGIDEPKSYYAQDEGSRQILLIMVGVVVSALGIVTIPRGLKTMLYQPPRQ